MRKMFSSSVKWLVDLLPTSTDFCNAYAGVDIITPQPVGPGSRPEEKPPMKKKGVYIRGREAAGGRNLPNVAEKTHQADETGEEPDHSPRTTQPYVHGGPSALEKMLKHTIPGARYNSAARDPPPRCHPGTRVTILQDLEEKVHDEDTRVIWVHGPAGSGKSAVMQSLAEALSSSDGVNLATVFLSRDAGRDDANRVFPSIAYDLAVANPTYRRQIEEELALDPDFLSLSMGEQFQRLFVRPLLSSSSDDRTRRWVILIDGLDECQGKPRQQQIIENICEFARSQPQLASLVWIISTREEGYLKTIFDSAEGTTPGVWKQKVPINSPDAVRDVEVYLRAELGKVSKDEYPLVPTWPAEEDLTGLVHLCSGFFFLASSLAGYITEANSIARLAECLSKQHKAGLPWLQTFYTQIMSSIPSDLLPVAKSIIFFHVYQHNLVGDGASASNISLSVMCNILELKQRDVYAALYHLSSILSYPPPERAGSIGIEISHPSFLELASSDSISFRITSSDITRIWNSFQRILRQFNKTKSHRDIAICWSLDKDQSRSLDERQQHTMVQVAQYGWMAIMIHYCHDRCTQSSSPCPKAPGSHLGLSSYEVDRVCKEFDLESTMSCAQHQITSLLDWIFHHAPTDFERKLGNLGQTTLAYLDIPRFLQALCTTRFCRRIVSGTVTDIDVFSTEGLLPQSWEQVQKNLWNESGPLGELFKAKQHRHSTPVIVFRNNYGYGYGYSSSHFDPSMVQFAVIGPLQGTDPSGDVYYMVRY
ncbi:hypothetical protein D9756_002621 [Leucocoprinus leucothites]|uniref:NACHT domain-containing protein n=1 Tax=Leucocoprinus leucothites TaxID=201217 RepID=A0A8H5LLW6_9AGAR|nr:hypothetical protein D9756_002621 [Leucoagaricus leucothites]